MIPRLGYRLLVGGWTHPSETYAHRIMEPQGLRLKYQMFEKAPSISIPMTTEMDFGQTLPLAFGNIEV